MSPTVICRALFHSPPMEIKKQQVLFAYYKRLCCFVIRNLKSYEKLQFECPTPLNYIRWTFSRVFPGEPRKVPDFAYSYLRDKAEAEDVLMESMIALWENRNRWKEGSNLHALLLTIIKNKSLNLLEHKKYACKQKKI